MGREEGSNPIIIIGAGRSGTKMLRNILTNHPNLVTWPCDEINPIWRYKHATYPTDELQQEHATPQVKKYIRSKFDQVIEKYGGGRVVEKTCANTLRVPYVYEIFPNAQFIHLIRNGVDVAESARRRWTGDVELSYILKKAWRVPLNDSPHYVYQFLKNRLYRFLRNDDRLQTWGPRFEGIDQVVKEKDLIEVCGIQWSESVRTARKGFEKVTASQVFEINYETLVRSPVEGFKEIFEFLSQDFRDDFKSTIRKTVTDRNIGKGKRKLTEGDKEKLMPHIEDTLREEGYLESGPSDF